MGPSLKVFSDLFKQEFNTQGEEWLSTMKSELKVETLDNLTAKKHLDLGNWPTLSLKAVHSQQMNSTTSWKKAAQTYYHIDAFKIELSLLDDLEGGARAFFFHKDSLNTEIWELIERVLNSYRCADEIEVYLLGKNEIKTNSALKVFDENQMIFAREAHEQGGHNVHELALLTCKFIEAIESGPTHLGVFLDSHFFKNIAKVRALKLLIEKVCRESGVKNTPQVITLNSYREWTLYERYSNMLRNNVQVASGYISGADVIQSSGYQIIFDLETNMDDQVHNERSLRMARNTSHILNLESTLGLVNDAAYGSYHLENLSHQYAEAAWKLMQVLLSFDRVKRAEFLQAEVLKISDLRLNRVKTRKDVLAGINDYPDAKEQLGLTLKKVDRFRVARIFEEIRLKVESLKNRPKVEILFQGDLGLLNNRINFIKNYFELIGLEVIEPTHAPSIAENKILVLCAKDEDYPELAKQTQNQKCVAKYLAGKVEVSGFEMIHAGQDVYQVLSQLVTKLVGEK